MTDLAAFLLARLDEDQAAAEAATIEDVGPVWHFAEGVDYTGVPDWRIGADTQWSFMAVARAYDREATDHIARWDPARVLAEVAAKRAIVEHYRDHMRKRDDPLLAGVARPYIVRELETMLRHLAAPYADHPDYREEWSA